MKKKAQSYPSSIMYVLSISILLILSACQEKPDIEKLKSDIIQTDIEFSNFSESQGMNAAFNQYCAEDVVILADNSYPVIGQDQLREAFSGPDEAVSLVWKPEYADVAASGELGYTYGFYEMTLTDSLENSSVMNGTYVTIWKKDKEGIWKFTLDAGTEGLAPQ